MIYKNENGTIVQILNTKESKTYSFVHLYEKGGCVCPDGCGCSKGDDN